MTYFLEVSKYIASEMLAIDGGTNGWRHIVLPLAHTDELVMKAVLAVSAFHMEAMRGQMETHETPLRRSIKRTQQDYVEFSQSPQALYDDTISGLRRRPNLCDGTSESKQATLVAVLVLLVAAMVTGRDDYATILGMLHSGTDIFGGEDALAATDLGWFLVRQVRK